MSKVINVSGLNMYEAIYQLEGQKENSVRTVIAASIGDVSSEIGKYGVSSLKIKEVQKDVSMIIIEDKHESGPIPRNA